MLIDFGTIPHSGTFLASREHPFKTIDLAFEFCTACAFIRRKQGEDNAADYTNVNRATNRQLPDYSAHITEALVRRGVLRNELIVEVGANDGSFLDILKLRGFTNCLGVEPSFALSSIIRDKGHLVENVHLNQTEASSIRNQYGPVRAVICRHTLEHVLNPLELLSAVKLLLDDKSIFFVEVPDTLGIIHDLRVHELWDEHLHYFLTDNLMLLVQRAGFEIDSILKFTHRSAENILLWCSPTVQENKKGMPLHALKEKVELCRSFASRWGLLRYRILDRASYSPKPIVCIGASHPQSNFLLFSGLGRHIDLVVDDDPNKATCFVPVPQPVQIVTTKRFLDAVRAGTIIRTAFGYERWMDTLCEPISARGANFMDAYCMD